MNIGMLFRIEINYIKTLLLSLVNPILIDSWNRPHDPPTIRRQISLLWCLLGGSWITIRFIIHLMFMDRGGNFVVRLWFWWWALFGFGWGFCFWQRTLILFLLSGYLAMLSIFHGYRLTPKMVSIFLGFSCPDLVFFTLSNMCNWLDIHSGRNELLSSNLLLHNRELIRAKILWRRIYNFIHSFRNFKPFWARWWIKVIDASVEVIRLTMLLEYSFTRLDWRTVVFGIHSYRAVGPLILFIYLININIPELYKLFTKRINYSNFLSRYFFYYGSKLKYKWIILILFLCLCGMSLMYVWSMKSFFS